VSDGIFAPILAFSFVLLLQQLHGSLSPKKVSLSLSLSFIRSLCLCVGSCLREFHVILVITSEAVAPSSIWHIVFYKCHKRGKREKGNRGIDVARVQVVDLFADFYTFCLSVFCGLDGGMLLQSNVSGNQHFVWFCFCKLSILSSCF